EINHAFDLLYPQRAASHGEQVGLGACFAMHLRGARQESLLMASILRRHGLPVLPEEIGFSVDEFVKAVDYAPQTRPGRFTVLEHLNLSTDQIRDAYADYATTISS
ncbi:iron-containing alcohol dehydrogenase family protein, partial [Streptomyces sp. SID7982]|nr:iron-containing alcohol dehydrogenase family protein [Streptomyces sp. SID7982]